MQRREVPTGNRRRYDVEQTELKRDVDDLIEALRNNSDPKIRESAALNLGKLVEVKAIESLIGALADPVQDVREVAADALIMIGEPAVKPLIDLLESPDIGIVYGIPQEKIEKGLTQFDLLAGPEGIPPEKRTLRHRGGLTQHDALGGPETIRKAGGRHALEDEDEGVAQHDLIADPEEVPPTKRILQHRILAQHDLYPGPEGVREHRALFPGVRRAGITTDRVPPGMRPGLRRIYAATILGEIADPRAEGALIRALSDSDPLVRAAAEDALERLHEIQSEATTVPPTTR